MLLTYCYTRAWVTLRFTVCILSEVWRTPTVIAIESTPGPGMSHIAQSPPHTDISSNVYILYYIFYIYIYIHINKEFAKKKKKQQQKREKNITGRTTLPQTKPETSMLHMEEERLTGRRVTRGSPHPKSVQRSHREQRSQQQEPAAAPSPPPSSPQGPWETRSFITQGCRARRGSDWLKRLLCHHTPGGFNQ